MFSAIFFQLTVTVFISIIGQGWAGHIYSWDVETIYTHDSQPESYLLHFALESGLESGGILLLRWPFWLSNQFTAKIYNYQQPEKYQLINFQFFQQNTDNQTQYSCIINQKINRFVWKTLKIPHFTQSYSASSCSNPTEASQSYSKFWNQPIEMKTVSDIADLEKAITYDYNTAFDQIYIEKQPPNNLAVELTLIQGAGNDLSHSIGQQNVEGKIFVSPTAVVPSKAAVIVIQLIKQKGCAVNMGGSTLFEENEDDMYYTDFRFTQNCSSVNDTLKETVAIANATCSISANGNKLHFFIPNYSPNKSNFTLKFFLNNPSYVASAVVSVQVYTELNGRPVDQPLQKTNDSELAPDYSARKLWTNGYTVQVNNYQLLYGYDHAVEPTANTVNQWQFELFYSQQPSYTVYNNLKFSFKIMDNSSQSSSQQQENYIIQPDSIRYQVKVDLGGIVDSVLPLTLSHNFAKGRFGNVRCQLYSDSDSYLQCENIEQFMLEKLYYISFRARVKPTADPNIGYPNFGKITIDALEQGGEDVNLVLFNYIQATSNRVVLKLAQPLAPAKQCTSTSPVQCTTNIVASVCEEATFNAEQYYLNSGLAVAGERGAIFSDSLFCGHSKTSAGSSSDYSSDVSSTLIFDFSRLALPPHQAFYLIFNPKVIEFTAQTLSIFNKSSTTITEINATACIAENALFQNSSSGVKYYNVSLKVCTESDNIIMQRGVKFAQGFQQNSLSPADDLTLDFVLLLLNNNQISTRTVIHAYTLSPQSLNVDNSGSGRFYHQNPLNGEYRSYSVLQTNLKINLVNFHTDGSASNDPFSPSLLRISGSLLNLPDNLIASGNKLAVFLDSGLEFPYFSASENGKDGEQINNIIPGGGLMSSSLNSLCSGALCEIYPNYHINSQSSTTSFNENYLLNSAIIIDMNTFLQTYAADILIPVKASRTSTNMHITYHLAILQESQQLPTFECTGLSCLKIAKVYQFWASPTQQSPAVQDNNGTSFQLSSNDNNVLFKKVAAPNNFNISQNQGSRSSGIILTTQASVAGLYQGQTVILPQSGQSENTTCIKFGYKQTDASQQKVQGVFCPAWIGSDMQASFDQQSRGSLPVGNQYFGAGMTFFSLSSETGLHVIPDAALIDSKYRYSNYLQQNNGNSNTYYCSVIDPHILVGLVRRRRSIQVPISLNQPLPMDEYSRNGFNKLRIKAEQISTNIQYNGEECRVCTAIALSGSAATISNPFTCEVQMDYTSNFLHFVVTVGVNPGAGSFVAEQFLIELLFADTSSTNMTKDIVDVINNNPDMINAYYNITVSLSNYDINSQSFHLFGPNFNTDNGVVDVNDASISKAYNLMQCSNIGLRATDSLIQNGGVILPDPVVFDSASAGSRGSFKLSFRLNYNGPLLLESTDKFTFEWKFLKDVQQSFKCVPQLGINDISFDFASFDLGLTATSSSKGTLQLRRSILISSSNTVFTIFCSGAVVPPNVTATASNRIIITWKTSNNAIILQQAAATTSSKASSQTITQIKVFPSILRQFKLFNTYGQDSKYVFQVTTTLNLTSQAKIYVEFGQQMLPRLQRLDGTPSCKLENNEAFCRVVGPRRLMIIMNRDDFTLDSVKQQRTMTIEIWGVTQPALSLVPSGLPANQIWIGIDDVGLSANPQIKEHGFTDDVQPDDASTIDATAQVLSANISSEGYRKYSNQSLLLSLTANVASSIYIDIWGLISAWSNINSAISCNIYYYFFNGSEKIPITNPIPTCKFIAQRRIEMNCTISISISPIVLVELAKMPFPNTQQLESLSTIISSNSLYNMPYLYLKYRIFAMSHVNNQKVSLLGWRYSQRARALYTPIPNNKIDFYWTCGQDNPNQEVHLGYLSTPVWLIAQDGNVFKSSFSLMPKNTSSIVLFTVNPSIQLARINQESIIFVIGAKMSGSNSATAGPFLLEFEKKNGLEYVDTPPLLLLVVTKKKCAVSVADLGAGSTTLNVPTQGYSQPIRLDFSNCFPLDSLQVEAKVVVGQGGGSSLIAPLASMNESYKRLSYDENSEKQLFMEFVVQGGYNPGVGQISFTLSDINAPYYDPIPNLDISILQYSQSILQNPTIDSIMSDTVTNLQQFNVNCNLNQQSYTIYYVYHLSQRPGTVYTANQIKQQTKLNNPTTLNQQDPYWTVFGKIIVYHQLSGVSVMLTGDTIKLGSQYKVTVYCENYDQQFTSPAIYSFNSSGFVNEPITLTLKFSTPLMDLQRRDITCALVYLIKNNKGVENFITKDFLYCDDYEQRYKARTYSRALQQVDMNNYGNSRERVLQSLGKIYYNPLYSTVQAEDTSSSSSQGYSYQFYILPNCIYQPTDQLKQQQNILDILYSPNFATELKQYMNSDVQLPTLIQKQVQQINAQNLPEINSLFMYVDMRSLNFTISVQQSNGYLYFGLDAFQVAKSSLEQLRQGYNGNWVPLVYFKKVYLKKNSQQTLYVDRLSDDLHYYVYYAITGEDPSANAQIKWDVQSLTFKIDRLYNIPYSYQNRLFNSLTILFILIMYSLMYI